MTGKEKRTDEVYVDSSNDCAVELWFGLFLELISISVVWFYCFIQDGLEVDLFRSINPQEKSQ